MRDQGAAREGRRQQEKLRQQGRVGAHELRQQRAQKDQRAGVGRGDGEAGSEQRRAPRRTLRCHPGRPPGARGQPPLSPAEIEEVERAAQADGGKRPRRRGQRCADAEPGQRGQGEQSGGVAERAERRLPRAEADGVRDGQQQRRAGTEGRRQRGGDEKQPVGKTHSSILSSRPHPAGRRGRAWEIPRRGASKKRRTGHPRRQNVRMGGALRPPSGGRPGGHGSRAKTARQRPPNGTIQNQIESINPPKPI